MSLRPTSGDKRIFAAAESLSSEIFQQSQTLIQPEDLVDWIRCHLELRPDEHEEEAEQAEAVLQEAYNALTAAIKKAEGKP